MPIATVFLYFSLLILSFSLQPCASAHLWGFLCGKFPWGPICYFSCFYICLYFYLMAHISAYLCGNFPWGSNSWGCSVECFLDLPPNATVFLYFSLLNSSFSLLPCASAHLWGFLCGKFPWGPIFYFSTFLHFSLFFFICV